MAARRAALTVVVLAAGQGKRLRSKTIKLLHPVAGRPMVARVVDAARALDPDRLIVVVGHQADQVRAALADGASDFVLQSERRGTGHAVMQAASKVGRAPGSLLLILNGDMPLLRAATLKRLVQRHRKTGAALTLQTALLDDPTGYGRVFRDNKGNIEKIVEEADLRDAAERAIPESNVGLYCGDPAKVLRVLSRLKPDNQQGEYYLTDAAHALIAKGEKVGALVHPDPPEILGVNTRQELSRSTRTLYARKAEELQDRGVTLLDASRTWVAPEARVGRDTTLYPDVIIEGPTVIGEDCVVRSGTRIANARLARGVEVRDHSVLLDCQVGAGAQIGPFAHLRPGSKLEPDSRVGNFVELKMTTLGRGSKANHLAYLGDAVIGAGSNIGAGTITCNYDGKNKFTTTLGRDVFIGSNSQLVAPVTVGNGAYVAAGSTVTDDVPGGALAIARSRQRNVAGWVRKQKERQKAARKAVRKRRKAQQS